jgi:hypothetical protein
VTIGRLRVVLAGGFLAFYPEGGGVWMGFLQYLLGLRALGHDVLWLELLASSGDAVVDARRIDGFFRRMKEYGLGDCCALLLQPTGVTEQRLDAAEAHGLSRSAIADAAHTADLLWNFASAVRPPLLSLFRRRVLVDVDPGHLQVAALTADLAIAEHDAFLTVGTKIHDPDCEVPTLGRTWRPFVPFVHLPLWQPTPDPGRTAPFTSVTQWTWEELWLGDRVLSVSKREAYLPYLTLPRRTGRPFELAVNLSETDGTGDRERLSGHGWQLTHPHTVAASPADYQRYIARSRAEFGCPKPIHRALRTGWFSDRSACYLASGRPVLFEDTGIGERLPTGKGLVLFRDTEEAAEAVLAVDRDWEAHARAAREIASEHLDGTRILLAMLEASA